MRIRKIVRAFLIACSFAAITSMGMVPTVRAGSDAAGSVTIETIRLFAIDNMTCALCPVTVHAAIAAVEGVLSVDIDFEAKTATVAFDPTLTTVEAIANASTGAGYPARAIEDQ